MTRSLIVRYTSDWPSSVTPSPAGEVVYGIPRRQDLMIALAQQQIAAQEDAARQIARSNLAGSLVIVNELNRQTDILASGIEQLGDTLSTSISESTERLVAAVDGLGDRMCASLDEIRWQLAQQGRTLDQILSVLLNSRNNEAQQLVRQGVRHYVNEQYEQAEERFRRALDYDSTDYQVLLNLAFIEIHKGDAPRAFQYFDDALSLPDHLDGAAKARGLWATARLHYAESEYRKALDTANRALGLEKATGDALFTTGVYAALAGERDLCLKRIRTAIEIDPGLFAKVAAAPNLGGMRADVLRLLSQMASAALADAMRALADNREALGEVTKGKHASSYQDLLVTVRKKIDQAEMLLDAPSYGGCLGVTTSLGEVREVIAQLALLERLCKDVAHARDKTTENERLHQDVVQECGTLVVEKGVTSQERVLLISCLAVFVVASFLTPLVVGLLSWVGCSDETVGRAFLGSLCCGLPVCMIAGVAGLSFWCLVLPRRASERARQANAIRRERMAASDAKLRESRAAFDAVNQCMRGLRDRTAQRLSLIRSGTTAAAIGRVAFGAPEDDGDVLPAFRD